MADSAQGRGELVILHLPDRVELVVVAAGAIDGETEERLGDGADDVFQLIAPDDRLHGQALLVLAGGIVRAGDEEAGRLDGLRIIGPENVARELEAGELVIRPVAIEGVDHPVAIAPGGRAELVIFKSVALAVAGQVEPPPRPPHAILGRAKVAIDKPLVGIGRAIVQERVDLLGRRRQAGQVEAELGG